MVLPTVLTLEHRGNRDVWGVFGHMGASEHVGHTDAPKSNTPMPASKVGYLL